MKQGQEKNGAQRLDKLIGNQGQYTRSQVKDLVRQGRVSWNGSVVRRAEQKVMPGDDIRIDGKPVIVRSHIYLMMNKPAGVVSASRDPRAGTVVDLVPEQWQRRGLFPAGRLDKDTTGFLLITNDGEFAHRMLAPKKAYSQGVSGAARIPVRSCASAAVCLWNPAGGRHLVPECAGEPGMPGRASGGQGGPA